MATPKKPCFADGGQLSKADQMIADINAKYGVSGKSAPAPTPAPAPAPPPPKEEPGSMLQKAAGLFSGRGKQIDKAVAGYANGGLIEDENSPTISFEQAASGQADGPFKVDNVTMRAGVVPGTYGNPISDFEPYKSPFDELSPSNRAPNPMNAPRVGYGASTFASPQNNLGGIAGPARKRKPQTFGAFGYSNGGKIEGPGTATSDSIPATVAETGEGIQVSNTERIISAKQEILLTKIAQMLGFDSVDAMLEAGTGQPVGPTIKGGKRSASNGWGLDNDPDEYAKAMQAARNNMAIPSMSSNNDAANGGIYKDVGLPKMGIGAGQAPTIYDNGGIPTTTDRVSGSLPVARQPAATPGASLFDKDPLAAMSSALSKSMASSDAANAELQNKYPTGTFDNTTARPPTMVKAAPLSAPSQPQSAPATSSLTSPKPGDALMAAATTAPKGKTVTAESAAAAYAPDSMRTNLGTTDLAAQNERMAKSLGYTGTDDFNKQFRLRNDPAAQQAELVAGRTDRDPLDQKIKGLQAKDLEQMATLRGKVLDQNAPKEDRDAAAAALRALSGKADAPEQFDGHVIAGAFGEPATFATWSKRTGQPVFAGTGAEVLKAVQTKTVGSSPHPEGTRLKGPDGKTYVVKNGQPVLAQ